MLQELVLWGTIGALLSAVGYPGDTWQFWCFLATYWAIAQLSKTRGRIEGMIDFLEMDEHEQNRIKRALEQAKEDIK